jgi:hypothetical protein
MPLTLRPTALSSPAYRDWADYIVREERDVAGEVVYAENTRGA